MRKNYIWRMVLAVVGGFNVMVAAKLFFPIITVLQSNLAFIPVLIFLVDGVVMLHLAFTKRGGELSRWQGTTSWVYTRFGVRLLAINLIFCLLDLLRILREPAFITEPMLLSVLTKNCIFIHLGLLCIIMPELLYAKNLERTQLRP